jgi:hypothetical protein
MAKSRRLKPESETAAPRTAAHEEIARLAYAYWEARRGEGGSPEEDWLRAERELTSCPTPPER